MKKTLLTLAGAINLFTAVAQIPTSGLIDHYSFDNTMTGSSGYTLPGIADYVDDRNSNTNSAQNITTNTMSSAGIPNLPIGSGARSVAFWYKSNIQTTHSLFNYGAQGDYFGVVYVSSPSQILVGNGANQDYVISHAYTGNWTHIAVTYESSATSVYINGVLAGSTNTLTLNTAASPVSRFGISPFNGVFTNYRIDDLLIYNRALTAQEVTDIFNNSCPSNTTPLVNLSICPGTSTTLSASGNNITWHDAPTGGNQLTTGNSFTTPIVTQSTTYYAATSSCANRLALTVNTVSTPTGTPITLSNDNIQSTNTLFDTYVLKRDGATVASGNSGGEFDFSTTTCGTYQAEFTNTTNDCPNRGASLAYNSGTCQHAITISSIPTPAFYSVGFGVEPGEPATAMNGTQLTFVNCQNALAIVKVRDANGCLYKVQWALGGFPPFLTFTSNSDTTTSCTIYSNTVTISPTAPTNTTLSTNQTICTGSSTSLSAAGTGTLYWFDAPTGGTQVGTGNSFTTPTLTANATYYVQSGLGSCVSSRTAIAVTINNPATGTDVQSVCGSLTWINGITYNADNNTATHTIVGGAINGCDSIVTLNLTINNATNGTHTVSACGSLTWINGITYNADNNTATHTIVGGAINGCDSIVTLNLTVTTDVDNSVTQADPILTSNQSGVNYQWIDCNNSNAPITGETGQSFTATASGSYAVIVTDGPCSETSACFNVVITGISETTLNKFIIHPNPAQNVLNITSDEVIQISIIGLTGEKIRTLKIEAGTNAIDVSDLAPGIYSLRSDNGIAVRFVKN